MGVYVPPLTPRTRFAIQSRHATVKIRCCPLGSLESTCPSPPDQPPTLERCLQETVARHEKMRSTTRTPTTIS